MPKRRRGRGEGSITRRQDGLYQASVSLGKNPDGTRHREYVYGRTKQEILGKLQDLRQHQQPVQQASSILFSEYAAQWLEMMRASLSPGSLRRYRFHVAHLIRHLGQDQIATITPLRIERLYGQLARAGCSAAEISVCGRLLGSILRAAKRCGLCTESPVADVPRPKVVRRQITPYTVEQVTTLLETARADRYFAVYVLAIDSGMRIGELLALAWESLDWERGTVRIECTLTEGERGLVATSVKTRKSRRTVRLSQATMDVLAEHRREAMRTGRIAAPVFCNRKGGYLWPGHFYRRVFCRLLRRAGLPLIHFHDLRHTCATLLLVLGEKTLVVSERLGHSRPSITTDVYQHLMEGMQDSAADKMQQVLEQVLKPRLAE